MLDGLQLLADDVAVWSAKTFSQRDEDDLGSNERMVGSRYFGAKSFARGRTASESEDSSVDGTRALTVKTSVTDGKFYPAHSRSTNELLTPDSSATGALHSQKRPVSI